MQKITAVVSRILTNYQGSAFSGKSRSKIAHISSIWPNFQHFLFLSTFMTQNELTRAVKSRVSEHYSNPYKECESILQRLGRKHTENDNASIKRAGVAFICSIAFDNYEFYIVYIRQ